MANDYSVDELNEKLNKTNQLLKEAEKRFEDLLKVVKNLQDSAGKGGMYGSDATSEVFKRAEKKTTEFNKQMDKMHQVRQMLIDAEYDRVGGLEKERQERTKQFILMRRDTATMIETEKTKRQQLRLMTKFLGTGGGMSGGLGGFLGMGAGLAGGQVALGGLKAGEKTGGLSKKILNYQQELERSQYSSTGQFKGGKGKDFSNMFERLDKISPTLSNIAFGKKQGDGDRKGGILGAAGGGLGKAAGVMGMLGAGAGGLIGGILMKGLESSPIFQSIGKIMNQAFSLYLRPIGDFFGGIFKPIATILLKYGAANARQGKKFMDFGEQVGKGIVAFFTNPIGYLGAVLGQIGENIKAAITGSEAKSVLDEFTNEQYGVIKAQADALTNGLGNKMEASTMVVSGLTTTLESAVSTSTQKSQEIIDNLQKIYDINMKTYADHIKSKIVPNMTAEQRAGYEKQAGTWWAKSEAGQATGLFDEEGQLLKDNAVVLTDSFKEATEATKKATDDLNQTFTKTTKDAEQAGKDQKIHMDNTTEATKTIAITFEEAQKEIKRRLDSLIKMQIKARTKVVDGKKIEGKPDADLVTTSRLLGEEGKVVTMGDIARYEARTATSLGIGSADVGQIQDYMTKYPSLNYNQAKALNKEMSKIKSAGTNNFAVWANWRKSQGIHPSLSDEAAGALYFGSKAMANGGIINEPIFGIGKSGQTYMMGERGSEAVVPLNGKSSLGTNVVININIAKVTSDVDLQQIKPIVERAILETHARRGII